MVAHYSSDSCGVLEENVVGSHGHSNTKCCASLASKNTWTDAVRSAILDYCLFLSWAKVDMFGHFIPVGPKPNQWIFMVILC